MSGCISQSLCYQYSTGNHSKTCKVFQISFHLVPDTRKGQRLPALCVIIGGLSYVSQPCKRRKSRLRPPSGVPYRESNPAIPPYARAVCYRLTPSAHDKPLVRPIRGHLVERLSSRLWLKAYTDILALISAQKLAKFCKKISRRISPPALHDIFLPAFS